MAFHACVSLLAVLWLCKRFGIQLGGALVLCRKRNAGRAPSKDEVFLLEIFVWSIALVDQSSIADAGSHMHLSRHTHLRVLDL